MNTREDAVVGCAGMTGDHIWRSLRRLEDQRFLAGQERYVDNIAVPGQLHGVVLRSLSQYYAGHRRRQGLLLGFSAFNVEEIGQGLSRLAQIKSAIIPMLSGRDVLKREAD